MTAALRAFLAWLERAIVAAFDEPAPRFSEPFGTAYPTSNVTVVEPWLADLEAVHSDDELRAFIGHHRPLLTGADAQSLLDEDMRRGVL